MGHTWNDRTRYSAALLSSNRWHCGPDVTATPTPGSSPPVRPSTPVRLGSSESAHMHSLAKRPPAGSLRADPVPRYERHGSAATGNKSFSREGFVGQFYFGQHADLTVVTQHGEDSAWFGQGYGDLPDGVATGNNTTGTALPPGARSPTWNGVLLEPHYVYSPQLIFIGRYETIRMSQQSTPGTA